MAAPFLNQPHTRHLRQTELARRWGISPRTLERWRWIGEGPAFLKIGWRVAYRMEDVEAYEAEQRRNTKEQVERDLGGLERFARGMPR
ncbi:helix-turn-helix transcriptional regulator [Roseomonas sp. GCM10028921]